MECVVDASVAIKWFLPEPLSDKAALLLRDSLHAGARLTAPDLFIPEVGNALWKRAVLLKDIEEQEARKMFSDLLRLHLTLVPSFTIAERAYELAVQERHPVYDTLYLALAIRRHCQFVTADQGLYQKLGHRFPQICWLGSL